MVDNNNLCFYVFMSLCLYVFMSCESLCLACLFVLCVIISGVSLCLLSNIIDEGKT